MNELDVQPATEETVVRLIRAARANDADAAPIRHSHQTDRCPPVARFSAVLRCGGAWTPDEQAHLRDCAFCMRVYNMFLAPLPDTDEATLSGGEATLGGARAASGEETVVEGARRPSSQPVAGAGEDTVTDRTNKKRG